MTITSSLELSGGVQRVAYKRSISFDIIYCWLSRSEETSVVNIDSETRVDETVESTLPLSTLTVGPSDQQTIGDDVSQMEQAWHVQCKNEFIFQCLITFYMMSTQTYMKSILFYKLCWKQTLIGDNWCEIYYIVTLM